MILLNILPLEGDFLTIKIVHDLRNDLGFSEEERAALQFEVGDDGQVKWLNESDKPKDVAIGEAGMVVIRSALAKLNEEKKLTEQHIPIYEKFVLHG